MKKGVFSIAILATTMLLTTVNAAQAGEGGAAGSSAIRFSGDYANKILSAATAAAVGKNGAAASASSDLSNTFATAVGGAGVLTVQGVNTLNQSYQLGPEDSTTLSIRQANKLTQGIIIRPGELSTLP